MSIVHFQNRVTKCQNNMKKPWEFPEGSVVSALPLQGAQVPSLVREPRSRKMCGVAEQNTMIATMMKKHTQGKGKSSWNLRILEKKEKTLNSIREIKDHIQRIGNLNTVGPFFFFFNMLAVPQSMWDPSSPTRGQIHVGQISALQGGLLTRGPPGKPLLDFLVQQKKLEEIKPWLKKLLTENYFQPRIWCLT